MMKMAKPPEVPPKLPLPALKDPGNLPFGGPPIQKSEPPPGVIRQWGHEAGAKRPPFGAVWHVRFADNGNVLATLTEDQTLQLWNVGSGEQLASVPAGDGHGRGTLNHLAVSPDGMRLAAWNYFSTQVKIRDTRTGNIVAACDAPQRTSFNQGYSFSAGGKYLLLGGSDTRLFAFSVADGKRFVPAIPNWQQNARYQSIQPTPDGKTWLIERYSGREAREYFHRLAVDVQTGQERKVEGFLVRHDHNFRRPQQLSPDGRLLAVNSQNMVEVVEWEKNQRLAVFEPGGGQIFFGVVAFTPDNKRLLAGKTDGTIVLLDVAEKREIKSFRPNPGGTFAPYCSFAVAPDGKSYAFGTGGMTLFDFTKTFGVDPFEVKRDPLPDDMIPLKPD
jgi:WD40 repeat protein